MQLSSNGNTHCSRLIFASTSQTNECVDFLQLERVRKVVTRSQSGVHGKIADVDLHRSRHAETQNELRGIRVLLASGQPEVLQEQPFILEYNVEGKKRRYIPDLLAIWGNHREAIEIKEDSEADLPENQERFPLIRGLLSGYGFRFRVWRKSEICAEPRLSNANMILRYRRVEVASTEHEYIRLKFSSSPQITLQTFHNNPTIAIQSILRLVMAGTLHIDWWKPLTLDSTVCTTPIGHQAWPQRSINSPHHEEGRCRDSL
ncbi:MAG: TnsA endonuclease N-terminal domain-containing protein [Acidobacteriaceae bacterium]